MSTPFTPSPQVRATLEAMNIASSRGEPFFFILDFELREGVFVPSPLEQSVPKVYFDFPSAHTLPPVGIESSLDLALAPEDYASYLGRYEIIRRGLLRGDSFLTNLTLRTSTSLVGRGIEYSYPGGLYRSPQSVSSRSMRARSIPTR